MDKNKVTTTSAKIAELNTYIQILKNSVTAYKTSSRKKDLESALEYSRLITKLIMKIYLENRLKK